MQSFAILIDYENFPCSPEGLRQFIADFSKRGTLVVKRAYADWVRCANYRQQLLANQVEMIELPYASKGKNSADIRLVVDAMEFVFTKPYINTFVIASADADFLPLLSRLREYNKQSIVVARSENAHAYMRTHCNEFVNGDVYLARSRNKTNEKLELETGAPNEVTPRIVAQTSKVPTSQQVAQIHAIMTEIWQKHGPQRPFDLATLGLQIKKTNNGLHWNEYGFKSFKPMVAYLATNGFLRIDLTNRSQERVYLARPANRDSQVTVAKTASILESSDSAMDETLASEAELVTFVKSCIRKRIRWDVLQAMLHQLRPRLFTGEQSDDAFLKLLQSLDARGSIDVTYDPLQATYYVSPCKTDFLRNLNDAKSNENDHSAVWTQPGLF